MSFTCDDCGAPVANDDLHFPHDRGCAAAGCDDGACACDHLTCEACCTECHRPAPMPGQVDMFGGRA